MMQIQQISQLMFINQKKIKTINQNTRSVYHVSNRKSEEKR